MGRGGQPSADRGFGGVGHGMKTLLALRRSIHIKGTNPEGQSVFAARAQLPSHPAASRRETRTFATRPDGSAAVGLVAVVTQQAAAVSGVSLTYVVDYGSPVTVAATAGADGVTYTASIPAAEAPVGALLRWYFVATDGAGAVTHAPLQTSNGTARYYGTIVADSTDTSTLPILEL